MNTEHTAELVRKALDLDLAGADWVAQNFEVEEAARLYNGIGAEFLGEKLREKTTRLLALFEPAALIHDLRYSRSDGTRAAFDAANAEFYENAKRLACAEYGLLDPRRYLALKLAEGLYLAVSSKFGWFAWLEGSRTK